MNNTPVVFGFPHIWNDVYTAYADIFRAIDVVQAVANAFVTATKDSEVELVQVLRALTHVNSTGMADVLILVGNQRGTGAMKVARSMFEVSITAGYLEKNPQATDLYLDFAHVLAWRHLQQLERDSPGKVPAEHMQESQVQYDRVKGKFEKNGRVRTDWSGKSVKQMADDVGRANLYEIVYRLGSELQHVNAVGLLGHELNWDAEALRISHGALLQTLVSLYNAFHKSGTEFREKIGALATDFDKVWKVYLAGRDRGTTL